ncbi:orotate phosphoribosyltransferase [Anaerobacterium chartisolvens]|uniref:Orotate phosphoribosyltransferase n=1 Tax=Anaerobacterium chartisolvens TaxID=1297424 RepID=A0A369BAQ9_9FIRM|nr:phosphoribosyltransferase domain-containing protein [Anaerobacterium chartisolvens]RCX17597.1 orotate phosphoribosyltransferase [Anaerobacterium chartisolvens]
MEIIKNKTNYSFDELIGIARRDNNPKRTYLFVNYIQAKHIPVCPGKALDLFSRLGRELADSYGNERTTIIGFAETATAVGAAVALCFKGDTPYLHTSREGIDVRKNIVSFEEEHSHATEQKLFCSYPEEFIIKADRIIFIEDEITTGKTILNFVRVLKEKGFINDTTKVTAASIVNGMNEAHAAEFKKAGVNFHYLVKIKYDQSIDPFCNLSYSQMEEMPDNEASIAKSVFSVNGRTDPRTGVVVREYERSCQRLAEETAEILKERVRSDSSVLVLGTEEFMYPAIFAAKKISEALNISCIKVHSTTRSPIVPDGAKGYPIKSRFGLTSFYSGDRQTFLYNLGRYDTAVVLTDSERPFGKEFESLSGRLGDLGCKEIIGIRWVE